VVHGSSGRSAISGAVKVNVINYSYIMKNSFYNDYSEPACFVASSIDRLCCLILVFIATLFQLRRI